MNKAHKKIVLAYSGGLDTSVAIRWLLEHKAEEVIAVTVDVGQSTENLDEIRQKALAVGAKEAYVVDAREEFVTQYLWRALKANASYEFGYPLSTSIARPLIAKIIADIAQKTSADAVAHGCTAKGNDQVRFELAWQVLVPQMQVVAFAREWGELCNRSKAIDYADKHNIPVVSTKKSPYSIDANIWGRSIECGILEDIWVEPPDDAFAMTQSPQAAPDVAEYIEIGFLAGEPVSLNGQTLPPVQLVEQLNSIAGRHGIGRYDQVENRLVGIKSREIYEAPAATVLLQAHRELEYLTNTKDLCHFKETIDQKYSEIIYNGVWFSPMREALDAFISYAQQRVTGTIRQKLYKGLATVVGRRSDRSLYHEQLATYAEADIFDHSTADGFIKLFGLNTKTFYATNPPKA